MEESRSVGRSAGRLVHVLRVFLFFFFAYHILMRSSVNLVKEETLVSTSAKFHETRTARAGVRARCPALGQSKAGVVNSKCIVGNKYTRGERGGIGWHCLPWGIRCR